MVVLANEKIGEAAIHCPDLSLDSHVSEASGFQAC